jgi:hypothetical protein
MIFYETGGGYEMKSMSAIVILLTVVLLAPDVAEAQDREGFWGGLGGGYGAARISSDETGDGDTESSGVMYVRLGGTLNEHLLLGGEFNMWRKTAPLGINVQGALKMYGLNAILMYYPSARAGFFLKGGGGVSLLSAEVIAPAATLKLDMGTGPGFIVGLGYDIHLGGNVSLTPALNLWHGRLGDLQIANQSSFRNWRQNVVDVTIGITFN